MSEVVPDSPRLQAIRSRVAQIEQRTGAIGSIASQGGARLGSGSSCRTRSPVPRPPTIA